MVVVVARGPRRYWVVTWPLSQVTSRRLLEAISPLFSRALGGAPEEIRTPDPQIRSLVHYARGTMGASSTLAIDSRRRLFATERNDCCADRRSPAL